MVKQLFLYAPTEKIEYFIGQKIDGGNVNLIAVTSDKINIYVNDELYAIYQGIPFGAIYQ